MLTQRMMRLEINHYPRKPKVTPMTQVDQTYVSLQNQRSQGYDEARRLGYTSIDLPAVEAEIGRLDKAARKGGK